MLSSPSQLQNVTYGIRKIGVVSIYLLKLRPRGKESTEVRKSQIKGKESENSYQELKRSRKGQAHTNTRN